MQDDHQRNVITGHVLRISGTRHMIRAGVTIPPIMMLARWDSNCVLRYAKDAPLKNITSDYKRGVRQEKTEALTDEAQGLQMIGAKAMQQLKKLEE